MVITKEYCKGNFSNQQARGGYQCLQLRKVDGLLLLTGECDLQTLLTIKEYAFQIIYSVIRLP